MSNKLTFSCSSCLDCKLFNCRHLAVQEISITCAIQSDIEFIVKTVQEYDQLEEQCPLKKHNEVYFCKMPSLQRTQDESNLLVDDSFLSIAQDNISRNISRIANATHLFNANETQLINETGIPKIEIHEPYQTLYNQVLNAWDYGVKIYDLTIPTPSETVSYYQQILTPNEAISTRSDSAESEAKEM